MYNLQYEQKEEVIEDAAYLIVDTIVELLDGEKAHVEESEAEGRGEPAKPTPSYPSLLLIEKFLAATHRELVSSKDSGKKLNYAEIESIVKKTRRTPFEEDLEVNSPSPILLAPLLDGIPKDQREKVRQNVGLFILLKVGSYLLEQDFRKASHLKYVCSSWGLLNENTLNKVYKHTNSLIRTMIEAGDLNPTAITTAASYGFYQI